MNVGKFDLWLEFEELDESDEWDADVESFNMTISVFGRKYALNVWSYGFFRRLMDRRCDAGDEEGSHGYLLPPDLFVETCSREHMENVVRHMLETRSLQAEWLVPDDES